MRTAFETNRLSSQAPFGRHKNAITRIGTDVEDAVAIVEFAANIDACANGMELVDLEGEIGLAHI
jgi:hypothetical protein